MFGVVEVLQYFWILKSLRTKNYFQFFITGRCWCFCCTIWTFCWVCPELLHLAHSHELLRSWLICPRPIVFSTHRGWTMSKHTVHSSKKYSKKSLIDESLEVNVAISRKICELICNTAFWRERWQETEMNKNIKDVQFLSLKNTLKRRKIIRCLEALLILYKVLFTSDNIILGFPQTTYNKLSDVL